MPLPDLQTLLSRLKPTNTSPPPTSIENDTAVSTHTPVPEAVEKPLTTKEQEKLELEKAIKRVVKNGIIYGLFKEKGKDVVKLWHLGQMVGDKQSPRGERYVKAHWRALKFIVGGLFEEVPHNEKQKVVKKKTLEKEKDASTHVHYKKKVELKKDKDTRSHVHYKKKDKDATSHVRYKKRNVELVNGVEFTTHERHYGKTVKIITRPLHNKDRGISKGNLNLTVYTPRASRKAAEKTLHKLSETQTTTPKEGVKEPMKPKQNRANTIIEKPKKETIKNSRKYGLFLEGREYIIKQWFKGRLIAKGIKKGKDAKDIKKGKDGKVTIHRGERFKKAHWRSVSRDIEEIFGKTFAASLHGNKKKPGPKPKKVQPKGKGSATVLPKKTSASLPVNKSPTKIATTPVKAVRFKHGSANKSTDKAIKETSKKGKKYGLFEEGGKQIVKQWHPKNDATKHGGDRSISAHWRKVLLSVKDMFGGQEVTKIKKRAAPKKVLPITQSERSTRLNPKELVSGHTKVPQMQRGQGGKSTSNNVVVQTQQSLTNETSTPTVEKSTQLFKSKRPYTDRRNKALPERVFEIKGKEIGLFLVNGKEVVKVKTKGMTRIYGTGESKGLKVIEGYWQTLQDVNQQPYLKEVKAIMAKEANGKQNANSLPSGATQTTTVASKEEELTKRLNELEVSYKKLAETFALNIAQQKSATQMQETTNTQVSNSTLVTQTATPPPLAMTPSGSKKTKSSQYPGGLLVGKGKLIFVRDTSEDEIISITPTSGK